MTARSLHMTIRMIILPTTAVLLLLLALSLPTPSRAWEKRVDAHGKTIIAYYASWQWYDRGGLAKPSNLDHSKVTRYNFAFFQINSRGDIWGTDSWADPITLFGEFDWMAAPGEGYCSWDGPDDAPPSCAGHHHDTGLIGQAHAAGVEVYPSIGGWTLSDHFPALAADPVASRNFAANCVRLIEDYDFDGIDIDWEYPGYADHSGTPEDTVNYSLFLQDIRNSLDGLGERTGRFYGLTAALPCGPDLIDNIQVDVVSDILTELNLMTYDFHGSWGTGTGVNAPLFDMDGSPEFSVHGCVRNWRTKGANADKINIGFPFYGRSFSGSGLTGMGQAFSGTADMLTWNEDEGSPQYFNIVDKLWSFTSVRDEQTKTQYAYNAQGLVSYDDERAICDKTEYAMDTGLNGYIIWEISGDLMADLSTPLLDAANDRLNNPGVRCGPGDSATPEPTPNPTPEPTNKPVLTQTNPTGANVIDVDDLFYPHFHEDGALVECRNGGDAPTWITAQMMKSSEQECCAFYSTPSSSEQCVSANPYYPDLQEKICVNDGNQPSFMTGDCLTEDMWECCQNFYQNDEEARQLCNDGPTSTSSTVVPPNPPPTLRPTRFTPRPTRFTPRPTPSSPNPPPSNAGGSVSSTSNYCGINWGDANSKCAKPCPGGMDRECSSDEQCFADCTSCVGGGGNPAVVTTGGGASTTSNYCGTNWGDANSKCSRACPGGMDRECPSDQKCFADCTGCSGGGGGGAALAAGGGGGGSKYCGINWGDANSKCATPCPGGMNGECPSDEKCFADCTGCSGGGGGGGLGGSAGGGGTYCGVNWGDANSKCTTPCPGGVDRECPSGEKCFADCNNCPPTPNRPVPAAGDDITGAAASPASSINIVVNIDMTGTELDKNEDVEVILN